jgi:mono/diheme cytochrome c family protein
MHLHLTARWAGSVALGLFAAALGCTATVGNPASGDGSDGAAAGTNAAAGGSATGNSGGSGARVAGGAGVTSEFPCAVQQLLATKCQACHKLDPPGALLASADFRKPSKLDPSKSVATVALERIQATTNLRMPPAPLETATAAEISAFSSWVQGGAMPSTCGNSVPTAQSPYDTPVVCTSMKSWTGGNHNSPLMRPGGACISCHKNGGNGGPIFDVSGTIFPTPHEPNDCNGVASAAGAQVVITGANGTAHTLKVNDAGNFYLEAGNLAYPYQAKVVYQGRERVMVAAQKSGDCNDCHTQDGRQNAPGRIFLP